jgi:hypothetical protein
MHDGVSAVAAGVTVANWSDTWNALPVIDGTREVPGKSFSGGGAITWPVPSTWVTRSINNSAHLYWVKLTMSATPTAATAGQLGVIRRSSLCAPSTLRTLMLIMREAPTGQDGPWDAKALFYETESNAALQRALLICAGEFDTDEDDLIGDDEEAAGDAVVRTFRMERR